MTLRELEIGDRFVHARSNLKKPKRFTVKGKPGFNLRAGQATRFCYMDDGSIVSKSCNLEVKFIGESKHKEKLKAAANLK